MITGRFVGDTPFIQVTVLGRDNSQSPFFVLDTGFSGDLQITPPKFGYTATVDCQYRTVTLKK